VVAIWSPACGIRIDHDARTEGPYVIAEDQSAGLTWITVGGTVVHKCESHDWLTALHQQQEVFAGSAAGAPTCWASVQRDGATSGCDRPVTWRGISVDQRGHYQWAWACDLHRGDLRHALRLHQER